MKSKIDYGLKFYREILGLESLHFGYWQEEPQDKELTIDTLKNAQKQYIFHLMSFIPKGVKLILDVGCGTGTVAFELKKVGYEVVCISPDAYQEDIFKKTYGNTIPFYRTKFEDFNINHKFDLILFCESAQYVQLDKIFSKSVELLNPNSYMLVSDYFRKERCGRYYKTTKVLSEFLAESIKYGFEIINSEDITKNVIPTLELAKKIYYRYGLPIAELISEYFQSEYPVVSKLLKVIFSKNIKKLKNYIYEHTAEKLDSKKFVEFMNYKIFLFLYK